MHTCVSCLGCMYTLQYLSQMEAQSLDAELMGPDVGYSVDQVRRLFFSLSVSSDTPPGVSTAVSLCKIFFLCLHMRAIQTVLRRSQ